MIIIVAFIPLFFLTGVEGRLLQPLGVAYIISLIASLIVSITITPVLSSYLITNDRLLSKSEGDNKFVSFLKKIYHTSLIVSFNHKKLILVIISLLLVVSISSVFFLGRNFLPTFNEGSITLVIASSPGISIDESNKIGLQAEQTLLTFPEVVSTSRKTGRAELSEHSFGSSVSEIEVPYVLNDRTRDDFLKEVRQKLSSITGIVFNLGQPISHKIGHIISGAKTSIAIKLFGTNLETMYQLANKIKNNIASVNGVADLSVEQIVTVPQMHIIPNREMLATYGISLGDFNAFINTAFGGQEIGTVYENDKSYDLVLRLNSDQRNSFESISNSTIDAPNGEKVPLYQIARIISGKGANVINRENVKRKIVISANVSGSDVRSVVNDIKTVVDESIVLPEDYYVEYGGQFESEEAASRTIFLVSIVSLIIIFFLLYQEFKDYITSAVILINLPLALIGGIATVWLSSGILSIPSLIGFITLFGIATRNGILMVSRYNSLLSEGVEIKEAIFHGSLDRLNPVLMTALTAALALIPLVIAGDQPGNEIQSPMAEVILGGLFSSTLLNLVILPIVYYIVMKWRMKNV